MLRMMGRDVHSNYGPTADTGGLMQHHAPTIYAYPSLTALLDGEAAGGAKAVLPGSNGQAVTERPDPTATFQEFHNETLISHRNRSLVALAHIPEHPGGAGVALYYGDGPKRRC